MKKRIVTAASILAGALVLFSAVYFAVLRPANQADEPAYVPVLAASPISADANTGANGSVECVCEPVDVEIVVPGGVTVPFYGSPVTLQLDSKIGFNKSICGAAEHDHDYSLKAYGIFDKSYGANAEITESGELTIYSQGLYWVDAILVHGDKPIKTVETCITATDTPEAEEECSCVISIGRNKSRMDLSGSDHLPTDGSPLYMQMYIETVIEDRLCTATHHKKLWAMQGYVEFAPEGAICGVTEDNQFYTDTPGLYSLRLPAWFDGNRIGFGGDLQVKADGE